MPKALRAMTETEARRLVAVGLWNAFRALNMDGSQGHETGLKPRTGNGRRIRKTHRDVRSRWTRGRYGDFDPFLFA